MLESFLFSLFLNALVMLLTPVPKFPGAKKYELSEFSIPTATEDRSQTVGWGVFRAAGNVIWFGDYRADPKVENVDVNLLKSTKVTKGYRYHMGLWLSLCGVTCDRVREIRLGDRTVWSGNLELSKTGITALDFTMSFNQQEGQEVPDGMTGRLMFFNQSVLEGAEYTALRNLYIESQVGESVPAYPNTLHAVFMGPSGAPNLVQDFVVGSILLSTWNQLSGARNNGRTTGFVGSGPNISPLTFTLERAADLSYAFPDDTTLTFPFEGRLSPQNSLRDELTAWVSQRQSVEGDANPALVELEVLTSRVPGLGPRIYPWAIDVSSYLKAADKYWQEGHGVSFAWETSRPVSELLTDLAEQTNSIRETDERSGRLRTKLIREHDQPVAAFDESNLVELSSFSRNNPDMAPNRITVPFIDRSQGWAERVAIAKNPAGIKGAGTVIDYRAEFFGVSREELAGRLASREARKHGSALVRASWVGVVPIGTILKPFDLVTLKHPKLGQTVRMRILSARFASYQGRLRAELEGIEDVFRGGYSGVVTTIPGLTAPGAAMPPASLTSPTLELAPYALHGDDADHLIYSAIDPDTATDTFRAAYQESVSWEDGEAFTYADDEQEPAVLGTLAGELLTSQESGTVTFTLSASAAQQWARSLRRAVYFKLGDEWCKCSSWNLQGTTLQANGVSRGLFDTLPAQHQPGAIARFLLGYVVLPKRCRTNPGGGLPVVSGYTSLSARAESRGPGGVLEPSLATNSGGTWHYSQDQSRAVKPLPPKLVRLSGALGSLSSFETPPTIGRAAQLELTWANRNRLSRSDESYFDTGNDYEPGASLTYLLEWESTLAGFWDSVGEPTSAAPGATKVVLDASRVRADARRLRVRLSVRRPTSGGDFVESRVFFAYWTLSN